MWSPSSCHSTHSAQSLTRVLNTFLLPRVAGGSMAGTSAVVGGYGRTFDPYHLCSPHIYKTSAAEYRRAGAGTSAARTVSSPKTYFARGYPVNVPLQLLSNSAGAAGRLSSSSCKRGDMRVRLPVHRVSLLRRTTKLCGGCSLAPSLRRHERTWT